MNTVTVAVFALSILGAVALSLMAYRAGLALRPSPPTVDDIAPGSSWGRSPYGTSVSGPLTASHHPQDNSARYEVRLSCHKITDADWQQVIEEIERLRKARSVTGAS